MQKIIIRTLIVAVIFGVIWGCNKFAGLPKQQQVFDDSAYGLETKIGFYRRANDAAEILISWDAYRGLRVFDVENQIKGGPNSWRLVPESSETFLIEGSAEDSSETVTFEFDPDGVASGYNRFTADGLINAERLPSPPYEQQLVAFSNGTVQLQATVFLPADPTPFAVIMIHGSGYSDRNNLWYVAQADYLARRGITVLLPDKRGSGKSGGVWQTSSFDDFANDALAATNFLSQMPEVKATSIGVMGLSLGGRITPLVADKDPDIAFVISVVSGFTTLNEALTFQLTNDWSFGVLPKWASRPLAVMDSFLVRDRHPTYWRKNGKQDIVPYWRDLAVPGLAVFGAEDEQDNVPVQRSLRIIENINAQRETPIDVIVYENMGHGLFDPESGWVSYKYLDDVTNWITTNVVIDPLSTEDCGRC